MHSKEKAQKICKVHLSFLEFSDIKKFNCIFFFQLLTLMLNFDFNIPGGEDKFLKLLLGWITFFPVGILRSKKYLQKF